MQDITFDNWRTVYSVPDELSNEIALMQRRINQLEDAIRYAKMKAETGAKVKGKKQSKWAIPEAIKAREYLYGLVNGQRELFR